MRFDGPTRFAVLLLAATCWSLVVGCERAPEVDSTATEPSIPGEDPFDIGVADGHYDPPPLFAAIADGELDRVAELLAAGEDVNQHDPVYGTPLVAALQTQDDELVAVVLGMGADRGGTSGYFLAAGELVKRVTDPSVRAVADAFAEHHELVLRADEGLPAMLLFDVSAGHGERLVDQHQADLVAQGWFLFRFAHDAKRRQDVVGLLPTAEKYVALAYLGTDGMNYNVTTERIVDWLKRLEADNPFIVTEVGLDYVGGKFLNHIRRPGELAERMFAFCPDIIDQGVGSVANLEKELAKPSPALYLWWD